MNIPVLDWRATYVDQVHGEHRQVLVEKVDSAVVDPFGNCLANLVRRSALNHIQASPSVLGLSTRGCPNEQAISQLPLQVVLLYVVGEVGGDLSIGLV
jgi:hypothetical protein